MPMKILVIFALLSSLLGQAVGNKDIPVTAVAGESWLNHLHRAFNDTSMGKTGRSGPPAPMPGEESASWQLKLSLDFATKTATLHRSHLYPLHCLECPAKAGLCTPPESTST